MSAEGPSGAPGGTVPSPRTGSTASLPLPEASSPDVEARSSQIVDLGRAIPEGMTETASERFKESVRRFALELGREVSRLEEAERADDEEEVEITATMVVKSYDVVRNSSGSSSRRSADVLLAQLVAIPAALFTPIAGAYLHSWEQWVFTGLLALVAISAQIYSVVIPSRR